MTIEVAHLYMGEFSKCNFDGVGERAVRGIVDTRDCHVFQRTLITSMSRFVVDVRSVLSFFNKNCTTSFGMVGFNDELKLRDF